MKRIDLSIEVQDTEIVDRGITAYTSKRYPGLAIHRAWSRLPGEWEVTHIQSGRSIAHLPSKAAAKAALPLLCKFSDWSGRATLRATRRARTWSGPTSTKRSAP